jgi:hypothetical protein
MNALPVSYAQAARRHISSAANEYSGTQTRNHAKFLALHARANDWKPTKMEDKSPLLRAVSKYGQLAVGEPTIAIPSPSLRLASARILRRPRRPQIREDELHKREASG